MCGRYTLSTPADILQAIFRVTEWVRMRARYNLAPMQDAVIVRAGAEGDTREAALARWGLVPHWADDPSIGGRMINARSETASGKPAFRDSFRRRRCLVPADGFYEWQATEAGKRPMLIKRPDDQPLAFAGLWSVWRPKDAPADAPERLETYTILTTSANSALRPIHERMPVILDARDFDDWLDPGATVEGLEALLRPCPDDALAMHQVSTRVNSPKHDDPSLIEPVGEEGEPGEQRSLF
ncbi:MAG: SOS response-associated peptidase [Phycisphaerales bacterium]